VGRNESAFCSKWLSQQRLQGTGVLGGRFAVRSNRFLAAAGTRLAERITLGVKVRLDDKN